MATIKLSEKRAAFSLVLEGFGDAVKRIVPRIKLEDTNSLIDEVEQLTQLQKDFLKKVLNLEKN